MTRIRSIKPDIVHDPELARCSYPARWLFATLITQADDQGRLAGAPGAVRGVCLPNDDVTMSDVDAWLDELARHDLIVRYEAERRQWLQLRSWRKHQRIFKPGKARIPPPPGLVEPETSESCATVAQPLRKDPPIGGRREEGGREEALKETVVAPKARPDWRIEHVFSSWIESTGRQRVKLDDKRRGLIRRALRDYPLEDVLAAVDGWRHSAHHRGENDRETVYNDLSLLLRNGENIERFRDFTLGALQANPAAMRNAQRLAALQGVEPSRKELTDGTSPVD